MLEILFTIPGLLAVGLLGPTLLAMIIGRIGTALENRDQSIPQKSVTKPHNVVELDTIRALSEIAKHPALRQHKL